MLKKTTLLAVLCTAVLLGSARTADAGCRDRTGPIRAVIANVRENVQARREVRPTQPAIRPVAAVRELLLPRGSGGCAGGACLIK